MYTDISAATARNWDRLHTDASQKLTTRANKRRSQRTFLPLEYMSDEQNAEAICEIIAYIRDCQMELFCESLSSFNRKANKSDT